MKKRLYRLNLGWGAMVLVLLMVFALGSGCVQREKTVESVYRRMIAHFNQERWSIALKECEELLTMMPDSQTGGVWLTIGCCQSKLKNYEEALLMWEEKVIRDHSDSKYIVDALFYSAHVYVRVFYAKNGGEENLKRAREYCERALEDKPRTRYRQTLVKRIKSLLKEIERIEGK